MKWIKALASTGCTVLLFAAMDAKIGLVPPLGKFLSPATGFWQNAESRKQPAAAAFTSARLKQEAVVQYDSTRVAHIFAGNDYDLYFTQGYVTAKDRLWQMDFMIRAAEGRLAEVVGERAVPTDRYNRRIGMRQGAEKTTRQLMRDPVMKRMLQAYTDGVNAYIGQLSPADYPVEFKLLDYRPQPWRVVNAALVMELMLQTLAGGSDEFSLANTMRVLGAETFNDLFPRPASKYPVVPAGTAWNFAPRPPDGRHATYRAAPTSVRTPQRVEGVGSNNWVLDGRKTASGYPLLASDPHLALTLPSIWYQVHLVGPGVNTCGVSIPGMPCVIVGFNRQIGWGITNVGADVLDWYAIQFRDEKKTAYRYRDRWEPVTRRVEQIRVRGGAVVPDTVLSSVHGPVVYEETLAKNGFIGDRTPMTGYAMRWIGHEANTGLKAFYLLNRARNYAEYTQALAHYTAPAQNFVFAAAGAPGIAVTVGGKFPAKYQDQGKFILDGNNPADQWQGWIPFNRNPSARAARDGFLYSANQAPADTTYPYYLNWQFASDDRARRLHGRLATMQRAGVDSMRLLQLDTYSMLAHDVLDTLLARTDPARLGASEREALRTLRAWNKRYDGASVGATLFHEWWNHLGWAIWSDQVHRKDTAMQWPAHPRTVQLLLDEPASPWCDDVNTPQKESCRDQVNATLRDAVRAIGEKMGSNRVSDWEWGKFKRTRIAHVAGIGGLGSGDFSAGGTALSVNALTETFGPSWRMVVEAGPQVKGYGVLPGGQSGNPGSFFYDNQLPQWKSGRLNPLHFPASRRELAGKTLTTLTLKNR